FSCVISTSIGRVEQFVLLNTAIPMFDEKAQIPKGIAGLILKSSTPTMHQQVGRRKVGLTGTEFDNFAHEYESVHAANIKISGENPEYFAEYKIRDVAALTAGENVSRILDFGAGIGASVPYFRRYFPEAGLTCVDVSKVSLNIGESRFPGQATFQLFNGRTLPLSDRSFDLVFAACVFHHIDHAEHVSL